MKYNRLIAFAILLMFLAIYVNSMAQVSSGGVPTGFSRFAFDDYQVIELHRLNVEALLAEDIEDRKNGAPLRFAKQIPLDLNINNSGTWTDLPQGGRIWRLKIKSDGALALGLIYEEFKLPAGSNFFIYNDSHSNVLGAFTHTNNPKGEEWATNFTAGDAVTLEYYEPERPIGVPTINISALSYVYRNVPFIDKTQDKLNHTGGCHVNVNCSPEGDNWQDQGKGVALISMTIGGSNYLCSGSLINNTNYDCTPYFLSAYHCGEGATISEINSWIFYFNFEAPACINPISVPSDTLVVVGATRRAEGVNILGSKSDMLLLELNTLTPSIAESAGLYFNGWSRSTIVSPNGVGIHHPGGDIKKISTYTSSLTSYQSTHWRVYWSSTDNGHGVTEGGSSGSPIFDNNGLLIGTLTGGYSACSVDSNGITGTGPDEPDRYGKFSWHWQSNGSADSERLKPWLDPIGTNPISLEGAFAPCGQPVDVDFEADKLYVSVGDTVVFTDLTSGTPISRNWVFESGDPAASTDTNPVITYNTAGVFDVSLTVTNATGDFTETKANYITVFDGDVVICDTIANFDGTSTIYTSGNGGYISGNNSYNDKSKAEYFSNSESFSQINAAYVHFAVATGGASIITFNVYDEATGKPGTILGSATIPLADIITDVTNQQATFVDFVPDISLTGAFFIDVVLPTSTGDTIAIITNLDAETTANTAWELWEDNTWHEYTDGSGWNLSLNHLVEIIGCADPNAPPVADFEADLLTVSVGSTVNFTDLSFGNINTWSWTFTGGEPAVSSEANPSVTYNTIGQYDVSLYVSNYSYNDTETKSAYINVVEESACATVTNFTGTPMLFTVNGGGGYLAGNNSYGDLAKAEYFDDISPLRSITNVQIAFGYAYLSGQDYSINVNIRNKIDSVPGTILGSWSLSFSGIINDINNGLYTYAYFNPAVEPGGPFFVEIELPVIQGDTLALITNDLGEASWNTGWERWADDGSGGEIWVPYDASNGWDNTFNHMIYINACPWGSDIESVATVNDNISVFPNPSTGNVLIDITNIDTTNLNITVLDIFGKKLNIQEVSAQESEVIQLDLSSYTNGIYIILIENDHSRFTKRICIAR